MSCQGSATSTQFSTSVGSSVSTSTSTSVTTIAGTTSTSLITSCLASLAPAASGNVTDISIPVPSCISSVVVTSTTVVGGSVSTAQVPVEITNFFTSSVPTKTLFAPCSSTSTSFSQTTQTVVSTPTSTITSTSASTLPDGEVTAVVMTVTSTLPPTSSVLTSAVPVATVQTNANDGGGSNSNIGTIVGATVGGFVGLLALVFGLWYIWHRRQQRLKWDDIFEKDDIFKPETPGRGNMLDLEDDEPRPMGSVQANMGPHPYVYGLVGAPSAVSPPSMNAGLTAVPSTSTSRPVLAPHDRSPSLQPLLMNNGFPSPRPSTGGSSQDGGHSPPPPSPNANALPGGRSASPGANMITGDAGRDLMVDEQPDSPTSLAPNRGQLFVTNPRDSFTPPVTPVLKVTNGSRMSMENNASDASPTVGSLSALRHTSAGQEARGRGLQRNDTVSSRPSVYSQASVDEPLPPVPKLPQRPERSPRRGPPGSAGTGKYDE